MTFAWCPACEQAVTEFDNGRCPWCDGPIRTRRGKPVGVWGKLSDDQLRLLHKLHMEGASMRELGRRIYRQVGYASAKAAAVSISHGWRRLGLAARAQGEATRQSNVERRAPASPGTADRKAYKRWRRARNGGLRRCMGVRLTAPRKGHACQHYAAPGSDYCWQHEPARRDEVHEQMAALRARIGA